MPVIHSVQVHFSPPLFYVVFVIPISYSGILFLHFSCVWDQFELWQVVVGDVVALVVSVVVLVVSVVAVAVRAVVIFWIFSFFFSFFFFISVDNNNNNFIARCEIAA